MRIKSERFHCTAEIKLKHHGECEMLVCPSYADLQGSWWSYRWTSVCASDGHSYGHIHQVRCLKDYHPSERNPTDETRATTRERI